MTRPRPLSGEEPNPGAATVPRPAATVMVIRDAREPIELLLVRRTTQARCLAGAWVFPGGGVDPGDGDGEAALRAAALRELREEAGLSLTDPAALAPLSRWITPPESRIRYDTWFFAAISPTGQTPAVDGAEIVEWQWITPRAALDARASGELLIAFPTIRHLELADAFESGDALLRHVRAGSIEPICPRILGSGEQARIVLPGERGYDA